MRPKRALKQQNKTARARLVAQRLGLGGGSTAKIKRNVRKELTKDGFYLGDKTNRGNLHYDPQLKFRSTKIQEARNLQRNKEVLGLWKERILEEEQAHRNTPRLRAVKRAELSGYLDLHGKRRKNWKGVSD
ncbi:MAG: hypothetical protein NTY48_03270 [Candidatus Diapherotrites archaeon]|nr:hypothetical protein [Candidatus Diapherotrites archaeon]